MNLLAIRPAHARYPRTPAFMVAWLMLLCAMPYTAKANCPAVTASFTATPVSVCGPGLTPVNFTNTSTGANAATATYAWYRNGVLFDNTTGLAVPAASSVNTVGTYTFRLIATDASVPCTDTMTITVVVYPLPNAAFTFAPNNACAGTSIAFNNNSTGTSAGTTWAWNFGDGGTATTANPSHTYAAGGTYNVTLTQTNAAGCTSTTSATVTVLPIPVVNISGDDGDGNTNNCLLPGDPTVNETVTFTNTTTGATGYSWDFGDGSPPSTATNPSHTYTTFGTYIVTMTATGPNGCTATGTITVVFEKYVSSSLTLNITEYSGCAPHTLTTLTNLSVNANNYTWNFGDGTPSITTTSFTPPTHTYTAGGTYTITLTASNSCNTATATISPIIIVAGPNANFNPSTSLGCAPQNISFANTSTGVSPANNYQWDMGNGNTYTNTTTPPVQTYPTQGTYTVTMIAGSACGYDTLTRIIVIDSIPVADITSNPLTGCTPLTVSTVNNSYGNSITYAWYRDGVYISGAPTIPNQVFTAPPGNTPQNHTIQLTVSNHCGTDTDVETITVHPAVVAQFNASPLTICEGGSVTFTQNSLGDDLTWHWDFDEGTTSMLAGPHTITYNTPGTYQVELIVNGFCGADTLVRTITVNPYPTALITPSVTSGCAPLGVSFTNGSTTGATYSWNFGAGAAPATSTLFTPPTVNYTTPGTSMVTLVVNALGCVRSDTVMIAVSPVPPTSFTALPNNGCTPLNVSFNNTSPDTPGNDYNWNLGNGVTSTLQTPPGQTYVSGIAGDSVYAVQLTVTTAAGCSNTANASITVHPLPVAAFTPLPDTVCANTAVAFLNNSTGAGTYAWNFGDATPGVTTMSPSHTYTAQGNYTAQLIATSAFGCRDTVVHSIYVDSIPASNFNFTTECVGDTTQFTDAATGGITSWDWNFGDGGTSALPNPGHLYAASGTYNVSLTVTNQAGCTHTISRLVTVNSVPVANFTNPPTCLGAATAFTDNTTGVPAGWQWDFGDGTPASTVQNPSHTYAGTGTYTVQLIAFGGSGCSDTVSHTITVTPVPDADFTFNSVCTNDSTFFLSTSLGAPDTYSWNFGDGSPVDNTNNASPAHIYTTAGTYNVTLVAGYAASGCTSSITIPVQAFPRTVPGFTSNTPCLGAPTNFTDVTTNAPITWAWDFGDGAPVDNTQNPAHTYATPGFYNVTLITQNIHTCTDTLVTSIQVFPLPVAGYGFDTVCANFNTLFTDASVSATLWQWDFGDGSPVSNASSPMHVFPASGTYMVQQVVTNAVGCTDTSIQQVTVNPNPVALFAVADACHTYANIFTDQSTGAIQWEWDFGDGSPVNTVQNPTHIYPLDGTYNIELIVANVFGCTDTIAQAANVLLQPQSAFGNNTVCAMQNVAFTDSTTGAPTTWLWDFGDGSPVDNTQNPTHTYTVGGTYNITLITGNMAGCMDTLVEAINVYTVPLPNFTADTVCLFSITHFTDLSTDPAVMNDWYWDYDDGNNSFVQNPSYIFMAPGTYNVLLTVTNVHGCDSSVTLPVIVNDIPVAEFTADTACVGGATNFTDLSTGSPSQWTWNFGDGATSTTGPNVSHTYAAAGTYVVTLIVGDGSGVCTDMIIHIVTVSNTVIADFTAADTACVGTPVTFTDASVSSGGPITSYTWDYGDGHSGGGANVVYTYDTPGTYTITHTVGLGGGCTSSATQTILIAPQPAANFSLLPACENDLMNFTSTSVAGGMPLDAFNWTFGDGGTATGPNVSHTYASDGNYTVTLAISSIAGCSDTLDQNVTIYPLPVAAFSNNIVCLGDSVLFTDASTVTPGSIATWNWDFGDGSGASTQSPYHVYTTQSDTFDVTLIVTTAFGCTDTLVQTATTLPIVDFNFGTDNANGCAPLLMSFGDLSTISGGSIVGWVWNFDDGNFSFQQNPTHAFPNAGQYYLSLAVTTTDGCVYADTLSYPITVYPQPVAGFSMNPVSTSVYTPEITFTDLSSDALYWEWDFGDMNYSNESNPQHSYTLPGTYTISQIVTNGYGCSDTTAHDVIILEESTFFAPNSVSPNGDGINDVFLPMGTGIVDYKLYIFDRWGELVFETTDINEGWDCRYKGIDVKTDVYVWRVVITDLNNELKEHIGHVTVLR